MIKIESAQEPATEQELFPGNTYQSSGGSVFLVVEDVAHCRYIVCLGSMDHDLHPAPKLLPPGCFLVDLNIRATQILK